MKRVPVAFPVALIALVGLAERLPAQGAPGADAIVARSQEAFYYPGADLKARVMMTLVSATGQTRLRELTMLRRNGKGGDQQYFIYFHQPADVRGMTFLVLKYPTRDDDRWLFVPAINLVRRLAARDSAQSFVGSDFTYEDIGGRELDDYTYTLLDENASWTAPDGSRHAAWILESKSRDANARFPRVVSTIRKDILVAVRAEIYNRRNEKQKTFEAKRVEKIGAYWTVMAMTMADAAEGTRTDLVVEKAEYNVGLKASDFTRVQLERGVR